MAGCEQMGEITMSYYTIRQLHPHKRVDYTAMEVAENMQIFTYIHRHLVAGTLTAPMRREASHGAWVYLKATWGDVASIPRTPQTEGLVRVILAGYASKLNAFSILAGDAPIILDTSQMKTAITASGCKDFDTIYTLACIWWEGIEGMTLPPVIVSAKSQQEILKTAYRAYRDNPTPATAEAVVIALLPVSEHRVCLQTGCPPTLEQASRARMRSYSHGRGYARAVQAYIDYIINSKKE